MIEIQARRTQATSGTFLFSAETPARGPRPMGQMMPASTRARVVRLNLGDAVQVRTAYAEILASAKAYAPQAQITGVSVQEMVGDGVEVIIGVNCDPQLGRVLLFGSGGVMVEVYNDAALRGAARSPARKHRP